MGTVIRPEISVKNRYWLPKHRFYELRHFCLQYDDWKRSYASLQGYPSRSQLGSVRVNNGQMSNPTAVYAEARLYDRERIEMVENVANEAGEHLAPLLMKAVTQGISYEQLKAVEGIPCCKDVWYAMYRRFFWLLDKARK